MNRTIEEKNLEKDQAVSSADIDSATPSENNTAEQENDNSSNEVQSKELSIELLVENSAHFGQQSCSAKMKEYVYSKEHGMYIINLDKTLVLLQKALAYARTIAEKGGTILWVGPPRGEMSENIIENAAIGCKRPFMTDKWIQGYITNFYVLSNHIEKLNEMKYRLNNDDTLLKKERASLGRKVEKRTKLTQGLSDLKKLPSIILSFGNLNAVKEAKSRNSDIKVILLADTDTPDVVVGMCDFLIPINYSSSRTRYTVASFFQSVIAEGREKYEARMKIKNEEAAAKKYDRHLDRPERMFEKKYDGSRPGFGSNPNFRNREREGQRFGSRSGAPRPRNLDRKPFNRTDSAAQTPEKVNKDASESSTEKSA